MEWILIFLGKTFGRQKNHQNMALFKIFFFYLDHDIGQNSNVIESQEVGINIVDWVVFVRLLVR